MEKFQETLEKWYHFSQKSIDLGYAFLDGELYQDTPVSIPLSTLNRHWLIAGATGTGKTKTIQKFLENLSQNGVPSMMMDIKWDISGIALPAVLTDKLQGYIDKFQNLDWKPQGFPVEFFALNNEGGAQVRATISEFWPLLLSRVLGLSAVQSSALAVIFQYADSNGLLLVDIEDLKSLLSYLAQDGQAELLAYGKVSPQTLQVIMRQVVALESQGANHFFGEKSLDIADIIQTNEEGQGQVNIIRLMNSLRSPQLFSTMMVQILSELFQELPEVGDAEKPKFVIVIDEAHLLFRDLPREILSELEMIMKLIRSKGVGVFFCTQNPTDIPEHILAQLGLKIQHALRAFTAKDFESIKKMAKNFPISEFYDVEKTLTNLGIGEAFITAIGENGTPTPLVTAKILPPESRMDAISDTELHSFLQISPIFQKYNQTINPESASEILKAKMTQIQQAKLQKQQELEAKKSPNFGNIFIKNTTKTLGTQIARSIGTKVGGKTLGSISGQIARGILGSIFR